MPVCKDVEGCQRGYEARRLRRCRRFLGDSNYKVRARWNAWLDEYARMAEALGLAPSNERKAKAAAQSR